MEKYDVVIVGAGPAGLCLARELSDTSLRILLLDRKKNAEDVQYLSSGSFIDPEEWSLPHDILNPVHQAYFCSRRVAAIVKGEASVIKRRRLLSFLEEEARNNKNLRIEYGSTVKDIVLTEDGVRHLSYSRKGNDIAALGRLFADCSGIGEVFSRKLKMLPVKPDIALGIEYLVPLKKEPHTTDLILGKCLMGGYGWIFPRDFKTAIIGCSTFCRDRFAGIEKILQDMWQLPRVSERCEMKPIERHFGVCRTGQPLEKLVMKNVLIIGDSALQTNPIVGEGIRFVMDAARMASKCIKAWKETGDTGALQYYERAWKDKYYSKYKTALAFQGKLRSYSADDDVLDRKMRAAKLVPDKYMLKIMRSELELPF